MADADSIATLAEALVTELIAAQKTVATAESCTGGWIAKSLTDVSGSSRAFGYGVVSYSNGAKESILGVATRTLEQAGAVSEETVREMVDGVLRLSGADLAVAVSGVAGPDGGSEEKPVGTVWIAFARRAPGNPRVDAVRHVLSGDRGKIRAQTVILALQGLRERLRIRG